MLVLALALSVHVACLGDSITAGVGVADPAQDAYPSSLGKLLGAGFEVRNFGHSGCTMMDRGDLPYERSPRYRAALDWRPDVAIVLLGTNDSKPQNVETHPDDFEPSFRSKVCALRAMNPKVRIFAALPPPAFPGRWSIREDAIVRQIVPRIARVARSMGVPTIDLHTPLLGDGAKFPDTVHPNEAGAARLAEVVAQGLRKAGVAPGRSALEGRRDPLGRGRSIIGR